ncbi:MAG: HDIG domain-containing protein [Anaerolineales bacterium]|nr:HDIG domain-containing protein [Anaerolineales bacterium]
MDEESLSRTSALQRLKDAWNAVRLWLIFGLGLAGMTAALAFPLSQRQSTFGLEAGDVAPQDILAPYPLSYTSEVLTEEARQAAANSVSNVYDPPDSQVAREQLDRLRAALDFIEAVRADENAEMEQKLEDLQAIESLELSQETARALLMLSETRWQAVREESVSVLEQVLRTEIRPDRVEQARRSVPALVSISMPQEQAELVVQLTRAFVAPNSMLNEQATQAARERARESVSPIIQSYAAGETIVSRGEIVTEQDIEALEHYGLLTEPQPWREIALRGLLVTLIGFSVLLYAYRVHPEQINSMRMAITISLLFITFTLGLSFMVPGRTVMPYLYPTATLPMLIAVLMGPGMGVMSAISLGALAGFLAPRGLEIGLYMALSGIMGGLVIGKAERLSSFFWAGLASSLAAVAVVVIFRFPDPATDLVGKATLMGAGLMSGLISASLGFGLLLLIGNLLGFTTNLQLIELARPDHPLLQFILRNAPGTYQHSLQVANLAEQAARAIGANALLTRVGALYHDAGKALRPQFFIENQIPGQNIHEQLDPTTSASVIVGHVKDGLELARKYRLPKAVRDFIPEHHGRLEASFQYQAAIDAAGGDEDQVDKTEFTYPGPRPRSRETALLMLADGVEAKARAESPTEEQQIKDLVRWVIQDRLAAGQLDRTNLTLKDLDTVRRSFVNTLRGMYHPRIRYPEGEEESEPSGAPEATADAGAGPSLAPAPQPDVT